MALPTFVASGTYLAGSSTAHVNAFVPVPAGGQADDIAVVTLYRESQAALDSIPTGFTEVTNSPVATTNQSHRTFWKRLTGADSGTYDFTWTGGAWRDASASLVRGCITTGTPLEIFNAAFTNSAVTTTPAVSGTTGGADRLLWWAATNYQFGTWTAPGGFTKRSAEGSSAALATATANQASQGGTGSLTGSCSGSGTTTAFLMAFIPGTVTPRETVDLTHVGSSTWVAPASSTAVAPTYPAGLAEGDIVYAFLHIKPDTATVATPANWSLVGALAGGSGTQGADAGATKVHVYKRLVPAGGLTGTQSFTITSGSSPLGFMRAYRASGTNVGFEETFTSWSVTTASTTIGGTAGASLSLDAKDEITCVLGTPSDLATTLTLTGLTATGATLGALTRDPNATVINAQGNDSSATAYRIPVTAGTSTAAPVATATSNNARTAIGFLLRVRATADVAAPTAVADTDTATLTDAASVAVDGTDTATLTDAASVTQGNFFVDTDTFTVSDSAAVTVVLLDDTDTATLDDTATGEPEWGPPTNLTATPVSDTQIDLTWDSMQGATGYDIERDSVVIATDVAGTSYSDTGLAPTTTYTYRARSVR